MNQDTLIDLLRHGEVVGHGKIYGATDVVLSDRGGWQMESATMSGGRSRHPASRDISPSLDVSWDAIYSSPLKRCRSFANKLVDKKDIPLHSESRLAELDFGVWEGRSAEGIMAEEPGVLEGYWGDPTSYTPVNGETISALYERVVEAVHEIAASHRGDRLLLITHGGVIRALLAWTLDMPLSALMQIEVAQAGMSRIRIPAGGKPSLVFHDGGALC